MDERRPTRSTKIAYSKQQNNESAKYWQMQALDKNAVRQDRFSMGGKSLVLVFLVGSLFAAMGAEVLPTLTVNGFTYTNVTITKVSATDIFFTSSNGMGNAKLKSLAPKLQKQFHYNPAKAEATERRLSKEAEKYRQQVAGQFPEPTVSGATPAVDTTNKQMWARSFLNKQAPELFVEQWLTPVPDWRNKFILYVFFATWSPACRAQIPELNAYQNEFSDRLVIVAISDEPASVVGPVTDPIVQYAVAVDTQARTKNRVGVTGLPHVMLIDPKGYVRWEGFPYLKGHEFSDKVIADTIHEFDQANE